MAKITDEDRHKYLEKIKPYAAIIHFLLKREALTLQVMKRCGPEAALERFALVEDMIFLATNYIIVNGISLSMLRQRNEEALNDSRKSLYKAVIYMEELVSPFIDAPFSDYEEKLVGIRSVDANKRYIIVKKMGLAIQLLQIAYGDKTKWRWAFVELEGRFAVVAKNIMNLKTAVINTDPASPDYEPTMYHLRLIKKLLLQAADRYREKYELSTNLADDFQMGIHFLNALKRIHVVLGEREDVETLKKKADIWTAKLEIDMKKQEEAELKKTLA